MTAARIIPALVGAICASSFAQPLPTVLSINHDHPTGQLLPGESVRFTAAMEWGAARLFWEIRGGITASPNLGASGAIAFPYTTFGSNVQTVINPGSPEGASVRGVQLVSGYTPFSFGFPLIPPPWLGPSLSIVTFDWTAPNQLGPVTFNWVPDPSMPNPLLYPTDTSTTPVPFPTTYVGTTLTVIPGPGAGVVLVAAGAVIGGRRRGQ